MATEVELKLVLPDGAAALARVSTLLETHLVAAADPQQQTNYYLDTADLRLRAQRAMLRLRRIQRPDGTAQYKLTAKVAPTLHAGILTSTEWERRLDADETASWQDGPPPRLSLHDLDREHWLDGLLPTDSWLRVLGAMHNQRIALTVPLRLWLAGADASALLTVELDRTTLSAAVERCEIELEHASAEALSAGLTAWLDEAGVAWAFAEESKYAWFLRHTEQGPSTLP